MKDIDLDKIYGGILVICAIIVITLVTISLSSDHKIRSYYLHQDSYGIKIYKDINWELDEEIKLDRTISYKDALDILDRLNSTIK